MTHEKQIEERLFNAIRKLHGLDIETLKTANAVMAMYMNVKCINEDEFRQFYATVLNCCDENKLNDVVYNVEKRSSI